ncbi:MAG: septum site-determining protein MinC [Thermodesulfobacteriota bacterium]|nr:septum site-determining protein MinC [Thermodesulfobacteriota bacterium]
MMSILTGASSDNSAFELKGRSQKIMYLCIQQPDMPILIKQMREQLGNSPVFFNNTPVVVDLSAIYDSATPIDFGQLTNALIELGMVTIGVRGGNDVQQRSAQQASLHIFPLSGDETITPQAVPPLPSSPCAKIITETVRSGQRLAVKGDLIVLSSVNAGAEIVATGNIHIYGKLRGRALAGGADNQSARVFCLKFNPELIAIAGEYLVNDELPADAINKTCIIALQNDLLTVDPIGTFTS